MVVHDAPPPLLDKTPLWAGHPLQARPPSGLDHPPRGQTPHPPLHSDGGLYGESVYTCYLFPAYWVTIAFFVVSKGPGERTFAIELLCLKNKRLSRQTLYSFFFFLFTVTWEKPQMPLFNLWLGWLGFRRDWSVAWCEVRSGWKRHLRATLISFQAPMINTPSNWRSFPLTKVCVFWVLLSSLFATPQDFCSLWIAGLPMFRQPVHTAPKWSTKKWSTKTKLAIVLRASIQINVFQRLSEVKKQSRNQAIIYGSISALQVMKVYFYSLWTKKHWSESGFLYTQRFLSHVSAIWVEVGCLYSLSSFRSPYLHFSPMIWAKLNTFVSTGNRSTKELFQHGIHIGSKVKCKWNSDACCLGWCFTSKN